MVKKSPLDNMVVRCFHDFTKVKDPVEYSSVYHYRHNSKNGALGPKPNTSIQLSYNSSELRAES